MTIRAPWRMPARSLSVHAGREPTSCYITLYAGQPVGYIQAYLIADYPEYAEALGVEVGAAGVDLFIGEEAYVHRVSRVGPAETIAPPRSRRASRWNDVYVIDSTICPTQERLLDTFPLITESFTIDSASSPMLAPQQWQYFAPSGHTASQDGHRSDMRVLY